MALRVTTVSSDVFLYDLGVILIHPTIARDLSIEFSSLDIKNADQLTTAIQTGLLIADDGTYVIPAEDYDPDTVLIQELAYLEDELYISEAELGSSGNTYIQPGTFPLALNSTAAATRNVYCPLAKCISWELAPGDKVVISGNAAAGTYTVKSVSDQQNFIVAESIVDSTGGNISVFHPNAVTRIGVDDAGFSNIAGSTLDVLLSDIDSKLVTTSGISTETHRDIDQLVHHIAEDSYEEITYSGISPTSSILWTDDNKTTKIREEQYTYDTGRRVETLTTIQYDASGTEVERLVETYTYQGNKVISVERELT